MKITPISFSGKYYDFIHNDPRKKYSGFRLGMPDAEIVNYPNTAGEIREEHIKAVYPEYKSIYSDDEVIGQDTTIYGLRYDVTAGNVRDEILREETTQKKIETPTYYVDFDNYRG